MNNIELALKIAQADNLPIVFYPSNEQNTINSVLIAREPYIQEVYTARHTTYLKPYKSLYEIKIALTEELGYDIVETLTDEELWEQYEKLDWHRAVVVPLDY